jgi:hypothetical protein
MATTTADDVAVSGTDYRYQGLADSFIAANTQQRDGLVRIGLESIGSLSKGFAAVNHLTDQWIGSVAQLFPAITASAMGQIAAVGADDALEFVKLGAALSNSASPPVPGYQNLGGIPAAQNPQPGPAPVPAQIVLPSKSTMTVATS